MAGPLRRRVARAVAPACAVLVAGCAGVGPGISGLVERDLASSPPLEATYLGSGGWIFRYDGEVVLTGPLYTHPTFFEAGLRPVESDTVLVDREMSALDVADTRVILVGHGHYDHLLDVPRVALRHATEARILGTRTVRNLLAPWPGLTERVDLAEPNGGDVESPGTWMPYGDRIRVLPLRSNHGPHFYGLELFDGSVDRPLDEPPTTARGWLTGETFAFLFDFLEPDGRIAYRVFYQDAIAAPPFGFAPTEEITRRSVDLAVIVPATYEQLSWHPEALVENLQPDRIVLGHWEDFFRPWGEPIRAFGLLDMENFEGRLGRVFDGEFFRPDIGTRFRFGPAPAPAPAPAPDAAR